MVGRDSTYRLGIDLGTTYTAAAVARGDGTQMVPLGIRTPEIPSVVAVMGDEVLVGDAAQRQAITNPESIAREFKRRIGDSTPLIIGGSPWSAESLTGRLLDHVLTQVKTIEGGPPDEIVVTHPANWREFKLDRLRQAMLLAGCENASLLPEPVAAAQFYAAEGRISAGQCVVVFDFGGGTFDAVVLQADVDGFRVLGAPKGLEHFGGIDLDHAMLTHVIETAELDLDALPVTDSNRRAISRLRQDCRDAKEHLSSDAATVIPVMLPGRHTDVRVTRSEFERMIRRPLLDSIAVVEATITGAGLETPDIDAVLLVGGSSRIPIIAQLIGEHLARPVLSDAHPKHSVASGAAVGRVGKPVEPILPLAPPTATAPSIEPTANTGTHDRPPETDPVNTSRHEDHREESNRPPSFGPPPPGTHSATTPSEDGGSDEALERAIRSTATPKWRSLGVFLLPFLVQFVEFTRSYGWSEVPRLPWHPNGWRQILDGGNVIVGVILVVLVELAIGLRTRRHRPSVDDELSM